MTLQFVKLWKNSMLSDVTLVAEDLQILCHKSIQALNTAYFRAMFKESKQEKVSIYEISPRL